MKFCAIPPIPNLSDFQLTDMHLCLAQLMNNEDYVTFYRERSKAGDYIILDNGAHESYTTEFVQLLDRASEIGAQEVVMSDVPFNSSLTATNFNTIMSFLDHDWKMQELVTNCGNPRFMFVPQVALIDGSFERFIDLARYMIKQAVRVKTNWLKFTIGIPLMYEAVKGGLYSILDRITWMVEDTDIEVHLLGWSRDLITPIDIAHDYPGVRSCDSAKPFVFAKYGIDMQRAVINGDPYPNRPENYFTDKMGTQEINLASSNLNFCIQALKSGDLPQLPEPADYMPATDGEN